MKNLRVSANASALVDIEAVITAFNDCSPISGSTHSFYKYPARFSPSFAATVIESFSSAGDVVLDPFMGSGTTIVEATRLGRLAIGSDINSLSVFLARVKTTALTQRQIETLRLWADEIVPRCRFPGKLPEFATVDNNPQLRNLHLPQARVVKKIIALALDTASHLRGSATRQFARCAILNAGQWALDGRRSNVGADLFRRRLQRSVHAMLAGLEEYARSRSADNKEVHLARIAAEEIHRLNAFKSGTKADLVVTSPPYPGIHILYHRWQVNGRRETPAPYWITDTRDGRGDAYYNLGSRRNREATDYFENLATSFRSIRQVMRDNGVLVQVVAFAYPQRDLPRYLTTMEQCGFSDISPIRVDSQFGRRIWRSVPRRAWHATMKGAITASREVLIIHRAV